MSAATDKAAAVVPDHGARLVHADTLRVLVLGLNAWAVLVALPAVLLGIESTLGAVLLATPLVLLVLGLALARKHPEIAGFALLGGFPTVIAGLVAAADALFVESERSTLALVAGAASLVAFGAASALLTGRPSAWRPSEPRPLGAVPPTQERPVRTAFRRSVLGGVFVLAFALAVVAPLLGGATDYEAAWGEAADAASVLAAVVAAALATAVLALFVGPALRASRERPSTAASSTRRALGLIGIAVVGAIVFALYSLAK